MIFIEKKRSLLFGLPLCFTTYTLNENKLTIQSGFLTIVEDDAYMYKIQDVRLSRNILERVFGLGTIICYTGDTTHPQLKISKIRHSSVIKEYILAASEESRRKRRMIHNSEIIQSESVLLEKVSYSN